MANESKRVIENTDTTTHHYGNEHDYQKILLDNIQLKQTVDNLLARLNAVEKRSKEQYQELQKEIAGCSNKVTGGTLEKSPIPDFNILTEAVEKNSESFGDLDLKFQLHENSVNDGHLVWKINNFQQRTTDAIIGKTRALHSAPCFTSKYGYKFCLRLYLHGDGMGKGTHLSLFLVLMKSEYDNILEWPFQKKIKFTLINQEDRSKDHVEKMFPNKDSSSFQKPKKDMNIASGCPMFMNLNRLQPEGFLKDDSLFVEVKID